MRISDRSVEEVKERADILSVASEFGTFKRQGSEYVALCLYPDHQEKTPSFYITPSKNLFHCQGCKRGGDAIKLVMDLTGAEFGEAVERLADTCGVEVEYESPVGGGRSADAPREERERKKEALRALDAAAGDYHAYLTRSPDPEARRAHEYLSGRGFSPETLSAFRVGYAPSGDVPGKGFCASARERHGLDAAALDAAGLAGKGGRRDKFAGRITFPISDARGRVVGFGGRVLPWKDTWTDGKGETHRRPKYLNSSGSEVFHKRRLLYGLNAALPTIRAGRRAVVVEGYTDAVMLHQAGVKDAVATCGTALTPEHLRLLAPHAERVVLVFDPDVAGERAVARAREASELTLDLRVAVLDADPADWLQEHSGEDFDALVGAAPGVVEHEIERQASAVRDADAMTRQRALEGVQKLIGDLSGVVLKNEYARLAARAFRVPVQDVLSGVGGPSAEKPTGGGSAPSPDPPAEGAARAERYLLSACVSYPEHAVGVLAKGAAVEGIEEPVVLAPGDFEKDDLAALYAEIVGRASGGLPFAAADLVAAEALRGQHALVIALDAEAEDTPEDVRTAVVREAYLRVAMLSRRRQRADTDDEDPAWDRLYAEERLIEGEVARCADAAAL